MKTQPDLQTLSSAWNAHMATADAADQAPSKEALEKLMGFIARPRVNHLAVDAARLPTLLFRARGGAR